MKQSRKEKFRKEYMKGLAEWYRDLDRQNITEDAIDAMARDYDNQTISEGRVYVTTNPNYKE